MKIRINRFTVGAKIPERAHYNDAGADVFSCTPTLIMEGDTVAIPLGFGLEIPDGYMGCIYPKSGLTKKGIIANIPPIDSGYRGEVHALVTNTTKEPFYFMAGQKVGQLVITPLILAEFVEELGDNRGEGAFGSTGS